MSCEGHFYRLAFAIVSISMVLNHMFRKRKCPIIALFFEKLNIICGNNYQITLDSPDFPMVPKL